MLIYNYQKEFLGIDEADLKALGFKNLLELRSESADFADLFVKTPGFVHNFKHVHWIDFIDCAESAEDSKVVINAKAKNYRCNIKISTIYLIDNPSQKAYAVNLTNLRELSTQENEQIAQDVMLKPTPKVTTTKTAIFENQNLDDLPEESAQSQIIPENSVTPDPYEEDNDTSTRIDTYDIPTTVLEHVSQEEPSDDKLYIEEESADDLKIEEFEEDFTDAESFIEKDNFKLDLDMDDLGLEEKDQEVAKEPLKTGDTDFDNSYVYDPKVASDELGLPVDLIKEFIEDFIAQADEFKDGLYTALNSQDIDNVKVLSHKLKGVAANLRVEDAFEVLTTVNVSDNFNEIKKNLDHFYIIIAKLAGKTVQEAPASMPTATLIEEDDDDLDISFKDEIQDKTDEDEVAIETKNNTVVEEDQDEDLMIEMSDLDNEDEDLYMDNTAEISIEEDIESPDLIDFDLESDEKEPELSEMPEEDSSEDLELLDFEEKEDNQEKESLPTETLADITYDRDSVANEIGIDKQSFDILFTDYIDESKELSQVISSAIEQGDSSVWKKGAMKLKGMSDNMRVHSFSTELDTLIDTNDADVAKETIHKISSILVQISNT